MLDGFRADLDVHVDTMAKRTVQFGDTALGTTQVVPEKTPLKPDPTNIYKTKDHLAALIDRYALAAGNAREAIAEAEDAGDLGTADIFTTYSQSLDKSLWFIEARTQETEQRVAGGQPRLECGGTIGQHASVLAAK
jgi:starvation-inducible DNA-binding protein